MSQQAAEAPSNWFRGVVGAAEPSLALKVRTCLSTKETFR